MEKIVILIYEAMGRVMSVVAQLPYVVEINSRIITWGFTALIFLTALILLLKGCAGPKGIHLPVRGLMGFLFNGAIAASAVLLEAKVDPMSAFSVYTILFFGLLMILMILVLAENMIIGKGRGLETICLWTGQWFMTALGLRVWYYNKTTAYLTDYQSLFPLSVIESKYSGWMKSHAFSSFIFTGKWIIVMVCLALGVVLMGKAKKALGGEYGLMSGALMVSVLAYMIFLTHEGHEWTIPDNFLVYAVMAGAQLLFLFAMAYVPVNRLIHMNKEKQKPAKVAFDALGGVAYAAITGVLWAISGQFCCSIAADGGMSTLLKAVSVCMSWFYRKLPTMKYAYNTNFLHPADRVLVGMIIAALLTIAVTILLFLILKLIIGGLSCEGITITWVRNCVLVFVVPVVLYWFAGMGQDQLGDIYAWFPALLRAIAAIGLLMCLSSILPVIRKKGAMSLVKWIFSGLIVSLLFSGLLIPVLMIFV